MKFNYQKRAYKAYLLQWIGTNLGAISAELRNLGYDSFEIERGTIMARGKGMSLLCIHQGNWLRFGQNGSFKVMRPDEQATYVPIQSDDDLRAELDALKDLAIWMTGCGYDFCQHDFFVSNRHLMQLSSKTRIAAVEP